PVVLAKALSVSTSSLGRPPAADFTSISKRSVPIRRSRATSAVVFITIPALRKLLQSCAPLALLLQNTLAQVLVRNRGHVRAHRGRAFMQAQLAQISTGRRTLGVANDAEDARMTCWV